MCNCNNGNTNSVSTEYLISVPSGAWTQIAPVSLNRTSLVISNGGAVNLLVTTDVGLGASSIPLTIPGSSLPLVLGGEIVGGLVTRPFWGQSASTTLNVGVWETEDVDAQL